jgi:putative lipoprotein (rSAM/lipoprotein system)
MGLSVKQRFGLELQRSLRHTSEQLRLMVRDVDGKSNGDYKNRVVEMDVTPDDVDRTNAGGWNQGTFNKQVDIKLEKK